MVSGLTILRADEAPETRTRWSYVILVEELRGIVADAKKDARELFRRVCFNALISNIDDHPHNHAVIAKEKDWKLSPAYDLTPSPVIAQERRSLAMDCGDVGRFANAKNILSQHARFLLDTPFVHAVFRKAMLKPFVAPSSIWGSLYDAQERLGHKIRRGSAINTVQLSLNAHAVFNYAELRIYSEPIPNAVRPVHFGSRRFSRRGAVFAMRCPRCCGRAPEPYSPRPSKPRRPDLSALA